MPRYKLRTLLILLAILPPLLAVGWWKYSAWRAEQERRRAAEALSIYWVDDFTSFMPAPLQVDAPPVKAPAKAGE